MTGHNLHLFYCNFSKNLKLKNNNNNKKSPKPIYHFLPFFEVPAVVVSPCNVLNAVTCKAVDRGTVSQQFVPSSDTTDGPMCRTPSGQRTQGDNSGKKKTSNLSLIFHQTLCI
ncbi:hypothetical protein ANANG_G00203270 [Anguilla anguilla]|uniref:Uncharacterized protein n=1 Tax=Anguilla anguilla TaxID=7936 RepID=A0A9D3LZM6_ANGAN|nr:hypothetical protein ANANG_G00203270 [Anguilla anguilla]